MGKAGSFFIESLGCAKNQVDSELMIASLEQAGWRFSDVPEEADILIVNTCGFISQAKTESIETGLALRRRFPHKKIYMVGCLSERYAEDLSRELSEIDGFYGNRDPAGIIGLVECAGARSGDAASTRPAGDIEAHHHGGVSVRTRLLSFAGSAYVKIAEGCGNRCTYCAIPLIRGDLKSRPVGDVIQEIRGLIARGIGEIILVAQDLGSYGRDWGGAMVRPTAASPLARLLKEISRIPGNFWVRLLYIHPDHFPEDLISVIGRDERLLPYFDIPFQHGSPGILSAMGRIGDPEKNLALVAKIRKTLPGAVIRSTFLVGFPGEGEEDFQRLLAFQESAGLDWLGVFTYSREEDTPAYRMSERPSRRTSDLRKAVIEERQLPITERALDGHVGKILDVLVEERVEGEELSIGRAYMQAPDVDGLTVVRGVFAPGSVVRVKIIRRNGLDLEAAAGQGPLAASHGQAGGRHG
jgi:ribosomal protein S12 methylthiotransferase